MVRCSSLGRRWPSSWRMPPETITRKKHGVAAATINTVFLKLAAQHCSTHIRSCLRLRAAAEQPGRDNSLRAHTETRAQMPILQPVNSLGIQLSRNIMNSGIDRFDFFSGSSFNDGTTQTARDPLEREAGSHPSQLSSRAARGHRRIREAPASGLQRPC